MTTYMQTHVARLRQYNRTREGHRPLVSFTCGHCGLPARSYVEEKFCHRCRHLVEAHR
jgi:hypothetical protein